jgi:hypothetical protein
MSPMFIANTETSISESLSESKVIGEMQTVLQGRFRHNITLYFVDAFLSALAGYGGAFLYLRTSWDHPVLEMIFCLASAYGLFRLGTFLHEIVHMPRKHFKFFKAFWNVMAGIPLGMPHFLYLGLLQNLWVKIRVKSPKYQLG